MNVKAVILDGSRNGDRALDGVRQIVADELGCKAWEVEEIALRNLEIRHCLGCFGCWMKTPGVCVIDDTGRDVARAFIQSDLVVLLTPVTFGGYSSELKKAIDRLACPILSPFFTKIEGETHHKPRYKRYPRLVGVGVVPQEGQADGESELIFTSLVGGNATNLHAPAHAAGVVISGQGADAVRNDIQALLAAVEVR
jgi:hypothetical protein